MSYSVFQRSAYFGTPRVDLFNISSLFSSTRFRNETGNKFSVNRWVLRTRVVCCCFGAVRQPKNPADTKTIAIAILQKNRQHVTPRDPRQCDLFVVSRCASSLLGAVGARGICCVETKPSDMRAYMCVRKKVCDHFNNKLDKTNFGIFRATFFFSQACVTP